MAQVQKAKVFRNGRSQAVRIPAEFRFSGDQVFIERNEQTGAITLSEVPLRRSLTDIFREFDEAGGAEFELERDTSPMPDRELF